MLTSLGNSLDSVDVFEGSHGNRALLSDALDGADALFWLTPPNPNRRGNQVIIAGRRAARLRAIAGDHPGITAMELDVGDTQAVDLVCGRIVADFPTLDLVVANAGVSKQESLTSDPVDLDAHDEIVSTNITGAVRTVSRLLQALQTQPHATVIVTTSGLGFVPLASSPTYCASKAFLHSWCESARHQLVAAGVDVIELVPPYVRTALTGTDQAIDPHAMPLDDYLTEVFAILDAPGGLPPEIVVERAERLRHAERDGQYRNVFQLRNPGL